MAIRKSTKKYYFSVEGETERWYLKWLQDRINETEKSTYKVSLDCPVQKDPLKRAKAMVVTGRTEIWHKSDYESNEPIHVKQFAETIDHMKAVRSLGKQITYQFGYRNLTFDLWIILHMSDCSRSVSQANFKRCLGKLKLSNVIAAVNRAKTIMQRNQENGCALQQYKGYQYYRENPSLAIWEVIEKILKECGLM